MLNENVLRDEWLETGHTYEEFKQLLTELSDCTSFVRVEPYKMSVLSLASLNKERARFYSLDPLNTGAPQGEIKIRSLALNKVLEKGDHARLLEETFTEVGTLFFTEGVVFFPAKKIMTRGLVQFGSGGHGMETPSFERDLYISHLFKSAKKSTFVIREIAGVKKLVAILSAKYKALPQSALCEIIEALDDIKDFGVMKTHLWMMNNWTSDIYVEFPEKAEDIRNYYELPDEFVPGLWLRTSDTGDSSVKIYPTWRHGNSISYVEKSAVRRIHSGKVELEEIIQKVADEAFAEYTRLPEAMCSLMSQSITDASWDLTKVKDANKNKKRMEAVIKKAFKKLNIVKAIGKGHEKSLREQLCAEFAGNIRYSAYDVATAIMSLPERLEGVNIETKHNLESAVSDAPYIKYSFDSEEELVLV